MTKLGSLITIFALAVTNNTGVNITPDDDSPQVRVAAERERSTPVQNSARSPTSSSSRSASRSTASRTSDFDDPLFHLRLYEGIATGFLGAVDEAEPDTPATGSAGDGGADLITEIRRAARQIDLPAAAPTTQPAEATLVGIDTILYTEADTFTTGLDLLGFAIELRATPTHFTWHHGDGTSQTTSDAGHPYPQHTVSHRYDRVHTGLELSLDITYTVDYRVDGGSWTTLPDTLTATGPPRALTVRQATPLLVRP